MNTVIRLFTENPGMDIFLSPVAQYQLMALPVFL